MNDDMMEVDPLDDLFVDKAKLDRALLARLIQPYIRLYGNTDKAGVTTTPNWRELNIAQKIMTYLLGRKALRLKGLLSEEEEKCSPSEIEEQTGIKGGSIRPNLSKLLDERLLQQEAGKYWVPDYALTEIQGLLRKDDTKS